MCQKDTILMTIPTPPHIKYTKCFSKENIILNHWLMYY